VPVAALIATLAYWGATLPSEPYNIVLMSLQHEVPLRAGSGTLTGTARVRVTSRKPDPVRTRAVEREVDEPL
jgi:hypothetical protein